jgi:hypothetical protein
MLYESTEDIQNALSRMINNVDLNVKDPTEKLKRQFFKATNALNKARHEFDLLNDMKDF